MKKFFLPVLVLLLLLGACGNDEEATGNDTGVSNNGNGKEQVDSENNSDQSEDGDSGSENAGSEDNNSGSSSGGSPSNLSYEDFFKKTSDAMQGLESYSLEFAIEFNDENGLSELKQKVDYFLPNQMHMTQTVASGGEENQQMEWYQTDDTIYMSVSGQWMKMPADNSDSVSQMYNAFHPEDYFEYVKDMGENFSLNKDGDYYVAKYEGSPEVISELSNDFTSGFNQEGPNPVEPTEITDISYEISVNASTFFVEGTFYKVTMIMDGKEVTQEMNMVYSNFNNLDPIVVPEDVKNSAQSLY